MSCYSFRGIKFGMEAVAQTTMIVLRVSAVRVLLCCCYPGPIIPNNGRNKLGIFTSAATWSGTRFRNFWFSGTFVFPRKSFHLCACKRRPFCTVPAACYESSGCVLRARCCFVVVGAVDVGVSKRQETPRFGFGRRYALHNYVNEEPGSHQLLYV
jgi:hypothetical protein